jgi:hypothetical protein
VKRTSHPKTTSPFLGTNFAAQTTQTIQPTGGNAIIIKNTIAYYEQLKCAEAAIKATYIRIK